MTPIVNPLIRDTELHFEHELWSRELAFWKDELKCFDRRIRDLTNREMQEAIIDELEVFKQRFVDHKKLIKTLTRFIQKHEKSLAKHRMSGDEVLDRGLVQQHMNYADIMIKQQKEYRELKKEFFRFLTTHM